MSTALISRLPLRESFQAGYLEFNGILPLETTDTHLRVAVTGEPAPEVLDDLEVSFGVPLEIVPVSQEALVDGVRRAFAAAESVIELVRDLGAEVGAGGDVADAPYSDARAMAS